MDIFKLVGSVFVDTDEANKSLSKTGEQAEATSSKLGTIAGTAGKVALGVGAAAAAGATALMGLASSAAETGDEIQKNSQKVGLSYESYQKWDYVMQRAGTSMADCTTGLKTLTNKIDDAKNGSATATACFESLGISIDDLNGMSREEAFSAVIAGLQGMEDSTERAALASDLLGKSGQNLTPLFNESAESTKELMEQCEALGLVMSDDAVDASAEFQDTLSDVKDSFGMIVTNIGTQVMPIIQKLLEWVIKHMPEIQATIGQVAAFISEAITALAPVIESLMPIVEKVFKYMGTLWTTVLKPMLDAVVKMLNGDFKGAFQSVFTAIGNIVSGVFSGLISAIKSPLNTIIGYVNRFIGGINSMKIPDWVPIVGGARANLSYVPYLAKGGEITAGGSAIVGEAGAELIDLPAGAKVTPLNDNNNAFAEMTKKLDEMQSGLAALANAIQNYNPQIVLSTGALVGELARPMDKALGQIATKNMRGVIA